MPPKKKNNKDDDNDILTRIAIVNSDRYTCSAPAQPVSLTSRFTSDLRVPTLVNSVGTQVQAQKVQTRMQEVLPCGQDW